MVGAFSSWSVALFPASHDGVVDLFWPCCIGAFHPTEFFDWQGYQQAAGMLTRCTVMRSVHEETLHFWYDKNAEKNCGNL